MINLKISREGNMTINRLSKGAAVVFITSLLGILVILLIHSSILHSADYLTVNDTTVNGVDQQTDVISSSSTTVVDRSLWVGEKKNLSAIVLTTGNKVLEMSMEHLEDIAADNIRKVVWVGTKKEIIQHGFDGSVIFRRPLKEGQAEKDCTLSEIGDDKQEVDGRHNKDHPLIRLSLDPSDGSLWYSAGREVVKLSPDGNELFRIEMPKHVVDISVDIADGSCWIGRNHHISRYSADGLLLLSFPIDSDNKVTALAADPFTRAIWIGSQKGLIKLDSIGQEQLRMKELQDIQDLEVNPATGSLWLVAKKDVYKYDRDGQKLFMIPLCPRENDVTPEVAGEIVSSQYGSGADKNPEDCTGNLVTLAVDSHDDTCWVATKKTLFRFEDEGTALLKIEGFLQIEALDIGTPKLDIIITEPREGTVLTAPSVTVRGTVNVPGATVDVNGTPADVRNLEFEARNIVLTAGTNTITASAENIARQSAKAAVQVIYEPPVSNPFLLVCPEPYMEQEAHEPVAGCPQQVLIGRIHYNYGFVIGLVDDTATALTIDGVDITPGFFYNYAANRRMYGEWIGSFFWSVVYFVGPDGGYPVTVTTANAEVKTVSATVTFIKDMVPPVIAITSPANGTVTNKQTITVNGVIDDPLAIVTDDKTGTIIPTVNGAFTYEFNTGSAEGTQYINIRATDGALNGDLGGIAIIRDTIPPQINTTLPAEGIYLNSQTIDLTGTIADQNPGTLSVKANNGQPQPLSISGKNYSGTVSLTVGSNVLLFTAIDQAGNIGTLSRTVIVDQDPPVAALISPPPDSSLTGTVVVSATAEDSLSGIQSVTMLIDSKITGTLTQPPYEISIDTFALTPGSHTLTTRALDKAGNQTETSITVTIPHQFGIQITAPLSGTTIDKPTAIIQGTIALPVGREIGVRVNGVPAEQQGTGFAAIVPLLQSQNTITAIATNIYGIEEQAIMTINTNTVQEQVRLIVNPSSGIMTTQAEGAFGFVTSMIVETYLTDTVTSYAWDLNGDGSTDLSGDLLTQVTATYQNPGLYFPTITVTDTMGNAYTETAIVNVLDRNVIDPLLKGKWEGMKEMMIVRDVNGAASYFSVVSRQIYSQRFLRLSQYLPQMAADMGEFRLVKLTEWLAEYDLRTARNGQVYSFQVLFMKDHDGLWRLRSF